MDNLPGSSRPTTPPTRPALQPDSASSAAAPSNDHAAASWTNTPAANKSRIVPTTIDPDGTRVVPPLFELCQVDDLINLIAHMLDRLIQHNDRIPLTPNALTRFHSRAPPGISVRDYLLRIAKYTNVEPCCLLMLLPYVDKVCSRLPTFTISSLTVHRFVIAAVSVGSKALSDAFCTNGRYARVGGVSMTEINLLEKEFCEAIDWRLTTSGQVLAHYYTSLVKSHPRYRLADVPAAPPPRQQQPTVAAATSSQQMQQGPALIPPRLTRPVSASNLPSPVPNNHHTTRPPPSSSSSSLSSSSMSVASSSSLASLAASASASASRASGSSSSRHPSPRTNTVASADEALAHATKRGSPLAREQRHDDFPTSEDERMDDS